jgi:hypothetical protein
MNDKLKNIEELLDVFESHAVDLGHLGPDFSLIKMEKARDALLAAIADLAPKWREVGDPPKNDGPVTLTVSTISYGGRWLADGTYSLSDGFCPDRDDFDTIVLAWMPLPALYEGQA